MKHLSRRRLLFASAAALAIALVAPPSAIAGPPVKEAPAKGSATGTQAPSPEDPAFIPWVLDGVDDMYRGRSSHGLMEMKVKTKHWTRAIAMESWSLGEDYSLVRIVAPKKERGTATLKAKDDLFTYLNKTGRTIKITGAMMGSSWMGSHLTNNDLVREHRLADTFTYRRATERETPDTYVFELTPKADAAVVWGRVDVRVRRADLLPTEQIFYDEELEPARKMTFADYTELGGRTVPSRMRVEPLDGSGEFTEVVQRKLELDVDIDASFFNLQKLRTL